MTWWMSGCLVLAFGGAGFGTGWGAEKKKEKTRAAQAKTQAETTREIDAKVMKMVAPGAPAKLPRLSNELPPRAGTNPGAGAKVPPPSSLPAAPRTATAANSAAPADAQPAAAPSLPLAPSQNRSVSASKQFLIDGGDLNLRGALSFFLDEVRTNFIALLQDREDWKIPVVVRLAPNETGLASAMASEVSQFENGSFHLQINLRMGPDFRQELLAREVLQMLLAERGLREAKAVTAPQGRILPPWLLEGMAEALAYKKRGGPDAVFASLFRLNNPPPVNELLSADRDGDSVVTRATFHAACGALVLALLDQPDGPARFRRMLGEIATAPDQGEPMLRKHFPGFGGSVNRLSKWWSLQLAQISQKTDVFAVMTPIETEEKLRSILVLRMVVVGPDDQAPREKGPTLLVRWFKNGKKMVGLDKSNKEPPANTSPAKDKDKNKAKAGEEPDQRLITVPIEEFAKLKGRDDSRTILVALDERLNEVLARGFPLHRPLALAYHEVVMQIMKGDDKEVPATLARLAGERKKLLAQMKSTESYLDWYQATQTKTKSGAFDDYFKAVREVAAGPKRKDAISEYLDDLEKEWEPVK